MNAGVIFRLLKEAPLTKKLVYIVFLVTSSVNVQANPIEDWNRASAQQHYAAQSAVINDAIAAQKFNPNGMSRRHSADESNSETWRARLNECVRTGASGNRAIGCGSNITSIVYYTSNQAAACRVVVNYNTESARPYSASASCAPIPPSSKSE